MANLKALRGRINSVKSTRKITQAMKMVAAAKLRRAQSQAEAARPYAERMARMLASLGQAVAGNPDAPKLLVGSGSDQVHLLVVVTAERGLAGAFNTNVSRFARQRVRDLETEGKTVKILTVGRKGATYLKRELASRVVGEISYAGKKRVGFEEAEEIAARITALLENSAGFYGSQMNAMDNATRNAGDMINRLTLLYNRTRQANITRELIEIISGAEAL
jgi:F-type H+-transporting ATPase subunit gamma